MRRVALVLAVVGIMALIVWLASESELNAEPARVPATSQAESQTGGVPLVAPQFAIAPLGEIGPDGNTAGETATQTSGEVETSAPLQVTVVHSSGAPAASVTVVTAAGEIAYASQITDAAGIARFDGSDEGLDLYVGGATPSPQRFHIEPARGEHRLELPPGALVGGIVLIDGQPPAEPVGLVLSWPGMEQPVDVPWRVRNRLATVDVFFDHEIGQLTHDGRFLFSGLPQDWQGSLGYAGTLCLEGVSPYALFRVERPATDLVLRLTWDGAVTGRVVDPLVGQQSPHPAAAAEVHFTVTRGGGSHESALVAGLDGRFRLPLRSDTPTDVDLQFRAANGRGRLGMRLEHLDPRVGRDLGDVVLVATGRAQFRAVDEAGHPLEGAVATALDATQARSQPTGPSGLGVLPDIMPGTTSLRADALGFAPTELALSAEDVASASSSPLEVVLHPAPLLEVRVLSADGRPAGRVNVEIHAHDKLFDCEDGSIIDPLQVELGATGFYESGVEDSGLEGTEAHGKAWTDAEGRCLFTRIRAGVPFTIHVSDIYGRELRPIEQLALAPREQREVEWTVGGQPKAVKVSVRDRDGTPLPGVDVFLHDTESPSTDPNWGPYSGRQTTSASGQLEFHDVFAARISIQAERRGYGTAWLLDQFVPAVGARFDLILGQGRTVDIQVIDADGLPRKVDQVAMTDGPRLIDAQEEKDDHYRLDDAPEGIVTLTAQLARRPYSIRHDTSQPHATIVLPKLGALKVRWTVPLQPERQVTVLVRSAGLDAWSRYGSVSDELRASNGPMEFSELKPGDYEVVLRQGLGWTGDNPPVSQVARVQVNGGETAQVVLEP